VEEREKKKDDSNSNSNRRNKLKYSRQFSEFERRKVRE